jgi:hypothetical protein
MTCPARDLRARGMWLFTHIKRCGVSQLAGARRDNARCAHDLRERCEAIFRNAAFRPGVSIRVVISGDL